MDYLKNGVDINICNQVKSESGTSSWLHYQIQNTKQLSPAKSLGSVFIKVRVRGVRARRVRRVRRVKRVKSVRRVRVRGVRFGKVRVRQVRWFRQVRWVRWVKSVNG